MPINRRNALKMSAGFAAAATGGFSCIELAKAGPIEVPVIDKLSVRVLVDSATDIYFKPAEVAGVKAEPGRSANSMVRKAPAICVQARLSRFDPMDSARAR